jgi:hypothetical protein
MPKGFRQTIKDAEWWMFLPFACVFSKMRKWVETCPNIDMRLNRFIFFWCNIVLSTLFATYLFVTF